MEKNEKVANPAYFSYRFTSLISLLFLSVYFSNRLTFLIGLLL